MHWVQSMVTKINLTKQKMATQRQINQSPASDSVSSKEFKKGIIMFMR